MSHAPRPDLRRQRDAQLAAKQAFAELRAALDRLPGRSEEPATNWLLQWARALQDPPLVELDRLPSALLHRHVGRDERSS